jgi:hypothetical protein
MRIALLSFARRSAVAIAALVLFSVPHTVACSFAVGYFYQVTALKGQVVGTSLLNDPPVVKAVETDGDGKFDFGPIKTGHYTLRVDGDQFDVEVKDLPLMTESVTIDVTPV